jgi:hypothetical protein
MIPDQDSPDASTRRGIKMTCRSEAAAVKAGYRDFAEKKVFSFLSFASELSILYRRTTFKGRKCLCFFGTFLKS